MTKLRRYTPMVDRDMKALLAKAVALLVGLGLIFSAFGIAMGSNFFSSIFSGKGFMSLATLFGMALLLNFWWIHNKEI